MIVLPLATVRCPVTALGVLMAGLWAVGCGSSKSAENPRSTGGSAGSGGATGTGGAGNPSSPPVDISGRWGLFITEDPVGVQLLQASDGTLTGRGCTVGAPGVPAFETSPFRGLSQCGDIAGAVQGRSASFSFAVPFNDTTLRYSASVAVSDDARRMAGAIDVRVGETGTSGLSPPTAWLRVADDADWLKRFGKEVELEAALGNYALTLDASASVGGDFMPGRTYGLVYWRDGIAGDLGSFWHTELSAQLARATMGSARTAGPVSPTSPALPTSVVLEFDSEAIRTVTATTEAGGRYTFTTTRVPQ
jgi:hypothetical protein